jgi:hypothetical protein
MSSEGNVPAKTSSRTIKSALLFVAALLAVLATGDFLLKQHAYSEVDEAIAALERQHKQSVVLSETPVLLGLISTSFASRELLEVKGTTSEFCLLLARDIPLKGNVDHRYKQLLGDAQLRAVLHSRDGKNYSWIRGGWQASHSIIQGRGDLLTCMWRSCNEKAPPMGAEITSIDVTSSRPLQVLGATWYSTDYFDSAPGDESSGTQLVCSTQVRGE